MMLIPQTLTKFRIHAKKLELGVYDRLAKAKANPIKGNARLHTA